MISHLLCPLLTSAGRYGHSRFHQSKKKIGQPCRPPGVSLFTFRTQPLNLRYQLLMDMDFVISGSSDILGENRHSFYLLLVNIKNPLVIISYFIIAQNAFLRLCVSLKFARNAS